MAWHEDALREQLDRLSALAEPRKLWAFRQKSRQSNRCYESV